MVKINLQVSNLLLTFVKTKNQKMKNFLFLSVFAMSLILTSCSNSEPTKVAEKPKETETYPKYNDWAQTYELFFLHKNGSGKLVQVDFSTNYPKSDNFVKNSIDAAFSVIETSLKSPKSFEPKSVSIFKIDGENIVTIEYEAVNSFNALLKGKTMLSVSNDGKFNEVLSNS